MPCEGNVSIFETFIDAIPYNFHFFRRFVVKCEDITALTNKYGTLEWRRAQLGVFICKLWRENIFFDGLEK